MVSAPACALCTKWVEGEWNWWDGVTRRWVTLCGAHWAQVVDTRPATEIHPTPLPPAQVPPTPRAYDLGGTLPPDSGATPSTPVAHPGGLVPSDHSVLMTIHAQGLRFRPDGTSTWQDMGDGTVEAMVSRHTQRINVNADSLITRQSAKPFAAVLTQLVKDAMRDEQQRANDAAKGQEPEQAHGETPVQGYGIAHTQGDDTTPPQSPPLRHSAKPGVEDLPGFPEGRV